MWGGSSSRSSGRRARVHVNKRQRVVLFVAASAVAALMFFAPRVAVGPSGSLGDPTVAVESYARVIHLPTFVAFLLGILAVAALVFVAASDRSWKRDEGDPDRTKR